MIKNVVFDVGGVLLEWDPPKLLETLNLPSHFLEVFESLLWGAHDGGILSRQEFIEKLPSHLDKGIFAYCVARLAKQLQPIPEMIELFHELRRKGYGVFILSNMSQEMHEELSLLHGFFDKPEGAIFSYQVKAVKPQPQIYEALFQKYKLYPEESLFIDDRLDNVMAAERLKMKAVHCKSCLLARQEVESLLL